MQVAYLLLADGNPFSHMGRNLRGGSGRLATAELAFLIGALAVVGVIIWLLVRHFNARDQVGYRSPRGLFNELCVAHQLDRRQRSVLLQLARRHDLEQPARLFLEPERYESQYLDAMPDDDRSALGKLRDRLFRAPANAESLQQA